MASKERSTTSRTMWASLSNAGSLLPDLANPRIDVLAYFDHSGTSTGPTEAVNVRLERLRGSPLGLRKPTRYIADEEFRISDGMSSSGLY